MSSYRTIKIGKPSSKKSGPGPSRTRALLPGSTLGEIPEAARLVRRETRHERAGTNLNHNKLSIRPTDQDPARLRRVAGFLSFEIVQAVNLEFDAVLVAEQTSWLLLGHTLTVFTRRERIYPATRGWALRGDSKHRAKLARRNSNGESGDLANAEA
jgi:hypothetical protein